MKKLAVIVPCYNEEAVIEESYRRTKEVLVKLPNPTEIIYINDGSQDKTRSLLDHIAATDPHVKVIHFSRNFGHQPAVTAGIFFVNTSHVAADGISFAATFLQKSPLTHSVAAPFPNHNRLRRYAGSAGIDSGSAGSAGEREC